MDRAKRYASGDVSASTYIDPANDVRPGCERSATAAVDALVFDDNRRPIDRPTYHCIPTIVITSTIALATYSPTSPPDVTPVAAPPTVSTAVKNLSLIHISEPT